MSKVSYIQDQSDSILFIDDEKEFLESVTELFPKGNKIYTATSLEAAWNIIKTKKIDCIFCDLNLSQGQNGIEFLKICRDHNVVVPFILVSGFLDMKKSVSAFRNGATDVIEKPLTSEYIAHQLNKYVSSGKIVQKIKSEFERMQQQLEVQEEDTKFIEEYLINVEVNKNRKIPKAS